MVAIQKNFTILSVYFVDDKNIHKRVLFFSLQEEKRMYGYTTPGKVFLIEHCLSFNTETSYNLHIPLKIVFFSEYIHRKNVYIHPQHKVKHCKHNVVWEVPSCSPQVQNHRETF